MFGVSVRNSHAVAVGYDGEMYLWGVITPPKYIPNIGTTKIILKQVPEGSGELIKDVELKRIAVEQLNYHDIVSINGDGQYNFSAVDSKGNYYHIRVLEE